MKVLILLDDLPTPHHPPRARAYYFIKFNKSDSITLLAFCRESKCEMPEEIESKCEIQLVKIPKLHNTVVKGFYSIKNRFVANNLLFCKDWNVFGRIYFPSMRDTLLNLLASDDFDVIYAQYTLCSYLYNLNAKIPIILDFSIPISYALTQLYRNEDSTTKKILAMFKYLSFQQEVRKYKEFDGGIYVSESHRTLSKPFLPKKSFIIPPGIDTENYNPPYSFHNPPSLVFVGNMAYPINICSILHFCRHIYPLVKKLVPDVTLYIVGRDPPNKIRNLSRRDNSIIVTGEVKDVRPYISKAHVVVTPITVDDGGIKTKVLEAMAMGKTVVSTSLGAKDIGVTHGENIIIADDPKKFSEYVAILIQDEKLRDEIGKNARKFVEENYSWEKLTNRLAEVLKEVNENYSEYADK